MKYGRVEEFTVEHATIRQQLSNLDFSGKTIKRLFSDEGAVTYFYEGKDPKVCDLEYYDGVFLEFTDGDVLEVQGWDGEKYDEVFFISVNDRISKPGLSVDDSKEAVVFGPVCYGRVVKGFRFHPDEINADGPGLHEFGLELDDGNVLWFRQIWDETNVLLTDWKGDVVLGNFCRNELWYLNREGRCTLNNLENFEEIQIWKYGNEHAVLVAKDKDSGELVEVYLDDDLHLNTGFAPTERGRTEVIPRGYDEGLDDLYGFYSYSKSNNAL